MTKLQVQLTDNWIREDWPYTQFKKASTLRLYEDARQQVSHEGLTRIGRPALPANPVIHSAHLIFDVTEPSSSSSRFEVDRVISDISREDGFFTVETDRNKTMRFPTPVTAGEYRIDITDFMSRDFNGVKYSVHDTRTGIDPNGRLTIQPKRIEITYDITPNAPNLTKPNGGETFTGSNAITWTPPTIVTAPTNELSYEVQYSGNNGQSWATLSNTAIGVTDYTHDFFTMAETSLGKIRVRAKHGSTFGAWDESDGVFSVRHNVAPLAPTNLTPSGIVVDRTATNKLAWKHNDSPSDAQSKADVRWRAQGSSSWNNLVASGPTQEAYVSSNVFPFGAIEWQVRTYDQSGLIGAWSNLAVFTSAAPTNIPIIIQPGAIVTGARPVVQWTSGAQQSYQIVVDNSLNQQEWTSGEVFSANKAVTIGMDMINGATYTIKVRIKDGSGLFSSYAEKSVIVSYTSPAKPLVNVYPANGYIAFNIVSPLPAGLQPSVDSHEIYKRVNDEWVRIAYGVGSSFNDYHVKSGQKYEYYAKAIGANGTTSNSDVVSQSTTFRGSWIHAIQDAEATLQYFRYNGTGYDTSLEPESAVMKFAGRTRPVVHFGAYEDYSMSVRIQAVEGMSDMDALRKFVRNRETVCYRDSDGNLVVGHILALNMAKDYRVSGATIMIVETDFSEEV